MSTKYANVHEIGVSRRGAVARKNVILALSCLVFATGVAWGGGPRLECAASAHDFGTVGSTAVVSHVFLLANTGDAPLKIDRTRVCCGATADLATNVVAAGTNTTLRVTVAMDGKLGQVEKAIYVMSNDPVKSVFRLTVTAAVPGGETGVPVAVTNGVAVVRRKSSPRS